MPVKTQATRRFPQPNPPARQFSFTDFQVNNPTAPPPGDRLNGELDRTNTVLAATVRWAGVSLNTDGTLRHATVGKNQLEPGLFDHIEADATQTIAPLVEDTRAAAKSALGAADAADASALAAGDQRTRAEQAAQRAEIGTLGTAEDAAAAAASAAAAAASATAAENSANHALGDANLAEDWAQVAIEWAEHMPDTIPPDILATNAMTGEHWSSRWWAHRAQEIVQEEVRKGICQMQSYWMGAYSAPPTENLCGDPLVVGAMFWNTTTQRTQVWDGTAWVDVVQPAASAVDRFLYLPTASTSVFTGADHYGHTLALDTVSAVVEVFLNGVKLLQGEDYSFTATTVTLISGSVGAPNTLEIVALTPLGA